MRTAAAVLTLMFLVTACSTDPGGGQPTPTGPVAMTLTPAGGAVEVVTDDLATVTFDFPPDSVLVPLYLEVTPLPAAAGELLRVAVEPAGKQLIEPVTITVQLPDGQSVRAGSTFSFVTGDVVTSLPTEVDVAAGKLTHQTLLLGYGEVAPASLRSQQVDSGWLNVAEINCQNAMSNLYSGLAYARTYPLTGSYRAHQIIQEIKTTEILCYGEQGSEEALEAMREQTKMVACEGYLGAAAATYFLTENADTLLDLSSELLNWSGLKEAAATDCDGRGGQLEANLEGEFDEFVTAYGSRIAEADFPSTYSGLWAELKSLVPLSANAALFGLAEAEEKVNERLLARIVSALRAAAYASCREDHTQLYLADIMVGGAVLGNMIHPGYAGLLPWGDLSEDQLSDDVQYCASALTLDVHTSAPRKMTELSRTLQGGATPGGHVKEASTQSGVHGTLALSGEIWAFNCARADEAPRFAADTLLVKLDNHELTQLEPTNGRFFSTPEEIDIERALEVAGEDPTLMNTHRLEVWRKSPACLGLYAAEKSKLFSVDVEFDPAPVLESASANPTSVQADTGIPVNFSLPYKDPGANLQRLIGRYSIGGSSAPLEFDLTDSTYTSGFDAKSGNGTYTANVTVYCSEKGNNPLRLTFTLVDAFDQHSEERSADVTIDYSGCA